MLALVVTLGACGVTEGQVFEPPDAAPLELDSPAGEDAGSDAAPPPTPVAIDADGTTAAEPDAGARPDASFEWSETLPGQGTCRAGRYSGSFACAASAGTVPVAIEGQISFTLGGSEEVQVLHVSEGTLGDVYGFFEAELAGELNCLTSQFIGNSVNGRAYALPESAVPAGVERLPLFGFSAAFFGKFDNQALFIAGNWSMMNDVGGGCLGGLWHAIAVP